MLQDSIVGNFLVQLVSNVSNRDTWVEYSMMSYHKQIIIYICTSIYPSVSLWWTSTFKYNHQQGQKYQPYY